jgi:hypothetical protein
MEETIQNFLEAILNSFAAFAMTADCRHAVTSDRRRVETIITAVQKKATGNGFGRTLSARPE